MKVLIVYYSLYGHIYKMAGAVAEGVSHVQNAEVKILRVPETLPNAVLDKMGATGFQKETAHVPVCTAEDLVSADAIIFAAPTRFGNMCGQMRQFLIRQTGSGPGINHHQFPHDTASPQNDYCRSSLYV